MDSDTILFIVLGVWGLLMAWLTIWAIKQTLKNYVKRTRGIKSTRIQPLTASTLNVGDGLLFKVKWQWNAIIPESSIIKVYYEVKERKPATIVFIRKDRATIELSYQEVDQYIADGIILNY